MDQLKAVEKLFRVRGPLQCRVNLTQGSFDAYIIWDERAAVRTHAKKRAVLVVGFGEVPIAVVRGHMSHLHYTPPVGHSNFPPHHQRQGCNLACLESIRDE